MLEIVLSPNYRLYLEGEPQRELSGLSESFAQGSGKGLLFLDSATDALTEHPAFAYWKDFTRLYLAHFASVSDLESRDLRTDPVQLKLPSDDLSQFLMMSPPMKDKASGSVSKGYFCKTRSCSSRRDFHQQSV